MSAEAILAEAILDQLKIDHWPDGEGLPMFVCTRCGGFGRLADCDDGAALWLECRCTRDTPTGGRRFSPEKLGLWLGAKAAPAAEEAAPALHFVEAADFLADTTPPPPAVIDTLGRAGTLTLVFGPPESGKSWLGLEAARCVSAGRAFLNRFPALQAPALLVEQESSPPLLRERFRLLEEADPRPADAAPLYLIPLQAFALATDDDWRAFEEVAEKLAPRLLVIDTAVALAGDLDLLSASAVRAWLLRFRCLAEKLGACVWLLCHAPKWASKQPQLAAVYGSVDFGASADLALALATLPGGHFRLSCVKNRWGTERPDLTFSLETGEQAGLVLTAADSREGVAALILDTLDGADDWVAARELTDEVIAAGFTPDAARKALQRLRTQGEVEAQGSTSRREYRRIREA